MLVDEILEYVNAKYPEMGAAARAYCEIALALAESIAARKFQRSEYTEHAPCYSGIVVVTNTPLHEVISVINFDGTQYTVVTYTPDGIVFIAEKPRKDWVVITYVGGYDSLPKDLLYAIGELAYFVFKYEPNIESIRSGDFNISIAEFPQPIKETILRYRGDL